MSVITHFEAASASPSIPKKSFVRRFVDRIIAAQEARATAEFKRHSHLLPRELDHATWKLGERSEDSLPFIR
jgi:predicted transcriptional regulator